MRLRVFRFFIPFRMTCLCLVVILSEAKDLYETTTGNVKYQLLQYTMADHSRSESPGHSFSIIHFPFRALRATTQGRPYGFRAAALPLPMGGLSARKTVQ